MSTDYKARKNELYSNSIFTPWPCEHPSMAASSSLSSLSRTPTPFSRYHTADESASIPADLEDVTDISSPGEAADHDFGLKAPYRDARALPEELKSRCQIHVEEQTCGYFPLAFTRYTLPLNKC